MKLSLLLVALVIGIAGCVQTPAATPTPQATPTPAAASATPTATPAVHTVEITASGFSPKTLTIKAGDTVMWTNKDSSPHWPASAVHPTHTAYPQGGGCIGSQFDACKGLNQGESWLYRLNFQGSWGYHDHLNPSLTGRIIVE